MTIGVKLLTAYQLLTLMSVKFLRSFFGDWYLQRFLSVVSIRKLAELFRFLAVIRNLNEICSIDDVSRGSVSCLLNASFKN